MTQVPVPMAVNFDLMMYEENHDLYLQVISKEGDGIMDF